MKNNFRAGKNLQKRCDIDKARKENLAVPAEPLPLSQETESALSALASFFKEYGEAFADAPERVFLRAEYHEKLFADFLSGNVCLQQSRRDSCLRLESNGYSAQEPSGLYDMCLVLGTSQREENLANFGKGLSLVKPGGFFVCAFANSLGAQRYEKILSELFPLEYVYSKSHSRVFGIIKPQLSDNQAGAVEEWKSLGEYKLNADGLFTCPGMFSPEKVDAGSAMLAQWLLKQSPDLFQGCGADMGAGCGYLALSIAQSPVVNKDIDRIDLYENERLSIEAARLNFKKELLPDHLHAGFLWSDITQEMPANFYDWIIMNPPFHSGQQKNLGLGRRFAEKAAIALRKKGALYMVANRALPYEPVLEKHFRRVELKSANNSFKVLAAWK